MNNMPYKLIDINQWVRRDIYHYFLDFEEPFHGVTVPIDLTIAKEKAQSLDISIFHYYMYHFLHALNESSAMKLRILDKKVVEYQEIHSGVTIMKDNGTYAYGRIFTCDSIQDFSQQMIQEKHRVQQRGTLKDKEIRIDMIHFSVLPWTNFTGLSHARRYGTEDSIPKITFGKISQQGDKWNMPMSIHVHHALVDGKDVGEFIQAFQQKLNGK